MDTNRGDHEVSLSGGFILFGGWLRITDSSNPNRKMECYCKFGGIGIGGWASKGSLTCFTSWDDMYRNTGRITISENIVGGGHGLALWSSDGRELGLIKIFGSLGSVAWGSAKWSQK